MELTRTPGAFHSHEAQPFWKIYQHIAAPFLNGRAVQKEGAPLVGISEHPLADGQRVIILVNYSPEPQTADLSLHQDWEIAGTWYGLPPQGDLPGLQACLPANDASVFLIAPHSTSRVTGDQPQSM